MSSKDKYLCPCGKFVLKSQMFKHSFSKIHCYYIDNNKIPDIGNVIIQNSSDLIHKKIEDLFNNRIDYSDNEYLAISNSLKDEYIKCQNSLNDIYVSFARRRMSIYYLLNDIKFDNLIRVISHEYGLYHYNMYIDSNMNIIIIQFDTQKFYRLL